MVWYNDTLKSAYFIKGLQKDRLLFFLEKLIVDCRKGLDKISRTYYVS